MEVGNGLQRETESMATAIRFINSTASHIFLTGKAGTGKTTFLKKLRDRTHKSMVVVAPTGIAALNAGGVTIHSLFLFPFGMFLPDRSQPTGLESKWYNANLLGKKHPLDSVRRQVLRSIDLLVIDEVSMLRSDLLDAIDYRLKSVRGNFAKSFGGVQLLLIGDLYQLPPVVNREDGNNLSQFYKSPWFFESKALQQDGFVYIELDKIFRQSDEPFIDLLNNLRNNQVTARDIEVLNRYYKPMREIEREREVITLTTHNNKADELNQNALQQLEGESQFMEASISGEFPDNLFPVLRRIELKEGAQIMFTRNDRDGAYFNGKLATVTLISGKKIEVQMAGSHISYALKKLIWENKKYSVDAETKELKDDVIGTFEQYPIKLAWAITVHKSQGLTFDKAIIDVGQAFADGQVYVALSRLRSLDGLILRTRIDPGVVSTDKQVVAFTETNHRPDQLSGLIKVKQIDYLRLIIERTFDFGALAKEINYMQRHRDDDGDKDLSTMPVLLEIKEALLAETSNLQKFRGQLASLLDCREKHDFLDRIRKGSEYYGKRLWELAKLLLKHVEETRVKKRVKGYLTELSDLDQLLVNKIQEVDKIVFLSVGILEGTDHFDFHDLIRKRADERTLLLEEVRKTTGTVPAAKPRRGKKTKKGSDEPSTYETTLKLLENGLSVDDIANARGLTRGTIEGHLAKAVEIGQVSIFKFMSESTVAVIASAIKDMPETFTSKDLYSSLEGKYGYGELKAVMSYEKQRHANQIASVDRRDK
ncbi:MAG TPA: helix-turn-helix domain-containing protein [Chryseolinea sp.]|nr:helix-turn-helix domain-containing protein [Chryseolinea sp.]